MKPILKWFENMPGWSFNFVANRLIEILGEKYDVDRVYSIEEDFRIGIHKPADVILCQNINNVQVFEEDQKEKVISRIGGSRVLDNNPHRYDTVFQSIFAVFATNKELYKIGKRKCKRTYIVPNGADLDLFKPTKNKKVRDFTIGFAANLAYPDSPRYKGAPIILGIRDKMGIKLKTAFWGQNQIPNEEMPREFYHNIDCLISMSENEGCSNVIMEALSCGVPVILTKVGYHGDFLTDKVNCLFAGRNVEQGIKAVKFLMDNPTKGKKIGGAGRKFAEQHHDIRKIAVKYDEIFTELLKEQVRKKGERINPEIWKVEANENIYEPEVGRKNPGDIFNLPLYRAKQMGSSITLLNREVKGESEVKNLYV